MNFNFKGGWNVARVNNTVVRCYVYYTGFTAHASIVYSLSFEVIGWFIRIAAVGGGNFIRP